MNSAAITLDPGVVLAGKYRIERVLGQGGMGVVAAAYHLHLEQRVALKLMLPHAMASSESVSRFLREARAAARITSEHIARVYDVGTLDTGAPYIAMEYLEGSDLSQLLATRKRLSLDEAIEYLLQACEALAEAHRAGIVHRDLKPGNLFLAQRLDGRRLIKVLDFGISKMTGASAQSDALATRTSALMGSPLYMSPEQMGSSRDVDARSDIWALGVVLYELVSGSPPFDGETLPQVCARVMSEPPQPLYDRAPGLPPALYAVVQRCLEKLPAARFQSVAELAFALEPMASPRAQQSLERISALSGMAPSVPQPLGQSPVAATTANPVVKTGPSLSSGTQATWGETQPKPVGRRSPAPVVGGLLAGMVITGGVAWLALRGPSSTSVLEPATSVAGSSQQSGPPALTAPSPPSSAAPTMPNAPATAEARDAGNAPSATVASATAPKPGAVAPRPHKPSPAAAKPSPAAAAAKPAAAAPAAAPSPAAQPAAPTSTRSRL